MQVRDVLQKTTQFFRDKGLETPRLDSEILLAKALGWERMSLYLRYEYPLNDSELTACRELVRRRGAGEPVAYILGEKGFHNHTFIVNPSVLIPRPETEMIVEKAVEWGRTQSGELRVVDLGTGSGCIGLSIISELATAQLLAVDVSHEALAVAADNALNLDLKDRAELLSADAATLTTEEVSAVLGGSADIVVSNPPYIDREDKEVQDSVRKFEPALALFSESKGLFHIRKFSEAAGRIARSGAFIMFEIGYQQGEAAREIFASQSCFRDVEIVRDLAGLDRFIRCFKN